MALRAAIVCPLPAGSRVAPAAGWDRHGLSAGGAAPVREAGMAARSAGRNDRPETARDADDHLAVQAETAGAPQTGLALAPATPRPLPDVRAPAGAPGQGDLLQARGVARNPQPHHQPGQPSPPGGLGNRGGAARSAGRRRPRDD